MISRAATGDHIVTRERLVLRCPVSCSLLKIIRGDGASIFQALACGAASPLGQRLTNRCCAHGLALPPKAEYSIPVWKERGRYHLARTLFHNEELSGTSRG